MKNLATRLLALVIVLSVLLMPASALAAERNTGVLTIGNFEVRMGEETIALPVYLQLGGGADLAAQRGFGAVKVMTETENALYALAAIENGEVKAYLDGMEYGLVMPLEQVISVAESALQASGLNLEDLMAQASSSMSPEMQAAVERLVNAAAALATASPAAEPDFGIVIEEGTEAEAVEIFDVTVEAVPTTISLPEQTLAAFMQTMSSSSPEFKEYWDAYLALIAQVIAESGEEDVNIEEIMGMVSMSMDGTVHTAEEGFLANVTVNMTVTADGESESIALPLILMSLTDENGTYSAGVLNMDVDGEVMQMTFYVDDYSEEGSDYTNFEITMSISDADSEEVETGFVFTLYTAGNETEGTAYGLDLTVEEYGNAMTIGGYYFALPAEYTDAEDSYPGYVYGYIADSTMEAEIYFDTNLTLSAIPAEELLTFKSSINPLEADEATLEKLGTDAMNVVYRGLGVLMQDPTIAALMGAE